MSEQFGLKSVAINGSPYAVSGTCSITPEGTIFELVPNTDQSASMLAKYQPGSIEINIRKPKSLKLEDLRGATGISVRVVLMNGEVYTMTDACQTGPAKLNASTGEVELVFSGGKLM